MNSLPQAAPAAIPTPAARQRRLLIGLYMLAAFLYWMSLYFYVPTLGVYAKTITSDVALIGVFLSMYGLWQAILRLPVGIAADWLGWRKPFIIAGFVMAALGAWMMAHAGNITGLVNGRAVTGLAAATWVPLVVVFSGLFPPEQAVRATTLLTFANSAGRMLASSINGSLNNLGGYSLAFYIAIGVAALAILLVIPIHEPRRPPQVPALKGLRRLFTTPSVILPSALNLVAQYATWATTFGFIPILAQKLGANDVTQSILVSMNIAIITIGNLATTAILKKISSRLLVFFSFIFLASGILAAALASSMTLVFVAAIGIGLANGIGYPVLMGLSIEQVPDAGRSTAMGMFQAIYAIGMFAGPWLSGILAKAIGLQPMFGVTAFATLALGLLGTRWLKSTLHTAQPEANP